MATDIKNVNNDVYILNRIKAFIHCSLYYKEEIEGKDYEDALEDLALLVEELEEEIN
jgi:hypothetical protein